MTHTEAVRALSDLKPGEYVVSGGALWTRCEMCSKVVRANKWLFGGLHLCLTNDEIAAKTRQRSR